MLLCEFALLPILSWCSYVRASARVSMWIRACVLVCVCVCVYENVWIGVYEYVRICLCACAFA